MIDSTSINSLFDATVFDVDGEKIGSVKQVFVGPDGGEPLFVSVATGLFGTSETFVPLKDATFDGESVNVAYDKGTVKDAPRIDADGSLSDEQHDRLWEYYGGAHDDEGDDREHGETREPSETHGDGRAAHANRAETGAGRVRLRKHVVTEMQHIAVPVQHEELRVERVPEDGGANTSEAGNVGTTAADQQRSADAGGRDVTGRPQ